MPLFDLLKSLNPIQNSDVSKILENFLGISNFHDKFSRDRKISDSGSLNGNAGKKMKNSVKNDLFPMRKSRRLGGTLIRLTPNRLILKGAIEWALKTGHYRVCIILNFR